MHDRNGVDAVRPCRTTRFARQRLLWVAVLAMAALGTAVVLETLRRGNLYWYDVRQDYAYNFSPDGSVALPVTVTHGGLVLPEWDSTWDTALLRLEVSSGLLGWWFDPCIEIATDAGIERQCFERGARGTRYVLLPPALVMPGTQVELRGSHLHWAEQTGELRLFDAPDISKKMICWIRASECG